MGLFSIFNKSKAKEEVKVAECFGETGELLGEIFDLASRYSHDDILLDTYSKEKLDVELLNKARVEIESALVSLGKSVEEYYKGEYTTVAETAKENKSFSYSLDAIGEIFNNSLDLYLEDKEARNILNSHYAKCNNELAKVKELLSDDKTLQEFTGLKPIKKFEIVSEEVENTEVVEGIEEVIEESATEVENEIIDDTDEVDGDLIINTEKIKVYYIRISRNEEEEINLNLCIENKLDKDIVVKAKDVSVDGTMTEPKFSCNVPARSRVYDSVVFKNDIEQLVNLECTFCIVDSDINTVIEECKVSMFKE